MTDGSIGARVFISYVHADDETFGGVVEKLSRELGGHFHALTGRPLEIFVDRSSIGWGENWRSKIRESVQSATVFIPIITLRYFQSDACREELTAFYQTASNLGVSRLLILPIVLAGAELLSPDSAVEEMRLIEGLQYKDLGPAWRAGYDSSEWRTVIHDMVSELANNLTLAESNLSTLERQDAERQDANAGEAAEEAADALALQADIANLTEVMQSAFEALGAFASAAQNSTSDVQPTNAPKDQLLTLIQVAKAVEAPALNVESRGKDFEKEAVVVDAKLRALVAEMRDIGTEDAGQQIAAMLPQDSFVPFEDATAQIEDMVGKLRLLALTNVSLRKALQPAIGGIKAIQRGFEIMRSWGNI